MLPSHHYSASLRFQVVTATLKVLRYLKLPGGQARLWENDPGSPIRISIPTDLQNTMFILCTIIPKGGRGLTDNITHRVREQKTQRYRSNKRDRTVNHKSTEVKDKLLAPLQLTKKNVVCKGSQVLGVMKVHRCYHHSEI